jgi:hypothetical protein
MQSVLPRFRLGATARNPEEFVDQWKAYNEFLSSEMKTAGFASDDGQLLVWHSSCCRSSACSAHLTLVGKSRAGKPLAKVQSFDFEHSCCPEKQRRCLGLIKNRSKRKYRKRPAPPVTGIIFRRPTSPIDVSTYEPFLLSMEQEISQYLLLPSIFETWQLQDMDGTYILENEYAKWDTKRPRRPQFQRCYIAMSCMKSSWKSIYSKCPGDSGGYVTSDASLYTSGVFQHTIVLAVTYDGENNPVILACAAMDGSKKEDWLWFYGYLLHDFPGMELFLADANQNIVRELRTFESPAVTKCRVGWTVQALMRECHGVFQNGWSQSVCQQDFEAIVLARTKEQYDAALHQIRQAHEKAAEWLDKRKQFFSTLEFRKKAEALRNRKNDPMDLSYRRFGHTGSDARLFSIQPPVDACSIGLQYALQNTETHDNHIFNIPRLPIAYMLIQIIQQAKYHHELRKRKGRILQDQGLPLTLHALNRCRQHAQEAAKFLVAPSKGKGWKKAIVTVPPEVSESGVTEEYSVQVNTEPKKTINCTCELPGEFGDPCCHAVAVLLKRDLNPIDTGWYHPIYRTEWFCRMYNAEVPNFNLQGYLDVADWLPIEHVRNPQEEELRSRLPSHIAEEACQACGMAGHSIDRCKKPSTEYQFTHNEDSGYIRAYQDCYYDPRDRTKHKKKKTRKKRPAKRNGTAKTETQARVAKRKRKDDPAKVTKRRKESTKRTRVENDSSTSPRPEVTKGDSKLQAPKSTKQKDDDRSPEYGYKSEAVNEIAAV